MERQCPYTSASSGDWGAKIHVCNTEEERRNKLVTSEDFVSVLHLSFKEKNKAPSTSKKTTLLIKILSIKPDWLLSYGTRTHDLILVSYLFYRGS